MINVTLQMSNWHIEDKTPYISFGKAGENNAVTVFLKGDDLLYSNPEENIEVEYFLDICDENDIISANTQAFTQSEDNNGHIIFSAKLMREFLGKEGVKRVQVRCVVTNELLEEVGTYESNVFHAIVKRNSGFGYKYDLAYFQQMVNNLKFTIETSLQNIMSDIMKKSVYDKNLNGVVDKAEKVVNPLVIYQNEEGTDVVTYDGSRQVSINITNSGGGGGGGGTTNYNMLNNKPSINDVVLEGNITSAQIGVPTKTSDLNNDSGFVTTANVYTKSQTYTKTEVDTELSRKANTNSLAQVATTGDYNDLINKPQGFVTGVKGDSESTYRSGNVNITKANIGLGNVGNFKAVSTIANQGLTEEEKANARANIGAGASGFSGDYNDLVNKPDLGTAASKDVAVSGDASTTQVVKGDDTRLTDSRPASDVYAWAKASTKPTYTANEVGAYNKAEVDNMISSVTQQLDWKPSVATYSDIATTYPNPQDGWTVVTRDTNYTYRFDGTEWINISANSIPNATTEIDGLMTSDKVVKLNSIESGAQVNTITGVKGGAETDYRTGNVNITKENIGLGNVPNVSTNNQTPTYSDTSTLATLVSGESLSVAFAKIKKAITELIAHIGRKDNPHEVTASQLGLATVATTGSFNDLTDTEGIQNVFINVTPTSGNIEDAVYLNESSTNVSYEYNNVKDDTTSMSVFETWCDVIRTSSGNPSVWEYHLKPNSSLQFKFTSSDSYMNFVGMEKSVLSEGWNSTTTYTITYYTSDPESTSTASHTVVSPSEVWFYNIKGTKVITTESFQIGDADNQTTTDYYLSNAKWSDSIGNNSIVLADSNCIATELQSIAVGNYSKAYAKYSFVEGTSNTTYGEASHVEGNNNYVTGKYAHVEGDSNREVTGMGAHVEGYSNTATANYTHAEGRGNTVSGTYSHVENESNQLVSSDSSHAEGYSNTANNNAYLHVEGVSNTISRTGYSHVEGKNNNVYYAQKSHIEGENNKIGSSSSSTNVAQYCHVEGYNNTINANVSNVHIEGASNVASANYAHINGYSNIAQSPYQTVIGKFNVADSNSDYALIVGNGTSDNARSNALAVKWNGNIVFSDGTELTPNEVLKLKSTIWHRYSYEDDGSTDSYMINPYTLYVFNNRTTDLTILLSDSPEWTIEQEGKILLYTGDTAPSVSFDVAYVDCPTIAANHFYEISITSYGAIVKDWGEKV